MVICLVTIFHTEVTIIPTPIKLCRVTHLYNRLVKFSSYIKGSDHIRLLFAILLNSGAPIASANFILDCKPTWHF